jgi:hypothetical protein
MPAPNDAAQELAACRLRVEDPARRERAHLTSEPHFAEIGVDPHLRELRTERVHRVFFRGGRCFGVAPALDRAAGAGENRGIGFAARRLPAHEHPSVARFDRFERHAVQRRHRIGDGECGGTLARVERG